MEVILGLMIFVAFIAVAWRYPLPLLVIVLLLVYLGKNAEAATKECSYPI